MPSLPPVNLLTCVQENDPEATVMSTLDADVFMNTLNTVKDWRDRGFWSRNAVVNTQNNTESFQAGKSALAVMQHQHRQESVCHAAGRAPRVGRACV